MLARIRATLGRFHKSNRYPVTVIAALGLGGFLLDYLWKPISTAGLILLALTASPWLIRVVRVKKGSLAGWEFELGYPSDPMATGERLAEELRENDDQSLGGSGQAEPAGAPENPSAQPPGGDVIATPGSPQTNIHRAVPTAPLHMQYARAYLAEGLVFQELQREFGGTIQREVRVGPYAIDGVVFGPTGPVAVEVKLLSSGKALRNRLVSAATRLMQLGALGGEKFGNLRPLLAIVVERMDEASDHWRRRLREVKSEFPGIDFRVFSLEDLLRKYGIDEG
jgi:hypothetical protein